MIQKIDRDRSLDRVETGAVQFGDDWPGIFIRGDNCFAITLHIRDALRCQDLHPLTRINLEGLLELLGSAII